MSDTSTGGAPTTEKIDIINTNETHTQDNSEPMTDNTELGRLIYDHGYLCRSYGKPGFRSFLHSPIVVLCSWAAAMCGFLYGYDQGLINVTLNIEQFLTAFPEVDPVHGKASFFKGLVTAIFELGAVIGALQSAVLCDRLSRRYTIVVAVVWYLIGSILQAAAQDYAMLTVGRFIGGIGVGGASMIAPLYISEIAPPHIRGALYTLQQWMLILGIVVAFYTTYGTRHIHGHWSWRTSFVVQMLPGLILLSIVTVLPFSPRWLCMQGRDDECSQTISKLRGLPQTDNKVLAEWLSIKTETILQQQSFMSEIEDRPGSRSIGSFIVHELRKWRMLFGKKYAKRVHIGVVLNAFQQWVGVNGFTYYSTSLFQQLGYGFEQRLTLSGLLTVVQLVGSTVPIFVIDRVGRRPLLLAGSFMLMCCHIIGATTIGTSYKDWAMHEANANAGTAFMFVFMFCFEISWGPIAWGMPSEILPSLIRSEGMALSTASNWLNNFVVGLIVPPLVATAPYASFALFACTSFGALLWVFFFVPETKGKTLEELGGTFRDDIHETEAAERHRIASELLQTHFNKPIAL